MPPATPTAASAALVSSPLSHALDLSRVLSSPHQSALARLSHASLMNAAPMATTHLEVLVATPAVWTLTVDSVASMDSPMSRALGHHQHVVVTQTHLLPRRRSTLLSHPHFT